MAAGLDFGIDTARLAVVRECSVLERMPKWLICVPLVVQWLWLSLRYGGPTVPSAANPHLTSGGLVGEGKLEYFRGMGPLARSLTADYCAVFNDGTATGDSLRQAMAGSGLAFPVVAKPDLGLCGYGVRLVPDMAALLAYLAVFPSGETVVLQRYLPQEGEAGIFYARDPVSGEGRIIGLALRYFPRVTGDGRSTVAQLVAVDVRARRTARSPRHQCSVPPDSVPAAGQQVRLATIGSTRVGGLYRDGAALITPELVQAIDAVARDMPDFRFGRFDVRYESLRELGAGRGFTIMEINGAGSEAIEAWDPDIGVVQGFRMVFAKQRLLFAIGSAQRKAGVKPIGLLALARLNRRQNRLVERYPPSN
ncbi:MULTISPECIES: hypothetical protein [unclassified Variovorax]|jgi:hypothetical protein|uniref:hypothetical protein n=1 Tax=unclassified Variovorax TaxID=663243 RepID=UPI000F7DDC8F|nr:MULTISPECIES: hypothetical protein [unclassified Variovorax]RSZ47377.1 hypothetical protein EJO70_01800 [Variovorax sp. 553]RSZ48499.1 hypothetical protein EJO71_02170 [Variovorax sp. 679]